MSGEGPKLFTDKPKKSKPKASRSTTIASSSSSGAAAAPPPTPRQPPPPPPKPQSQKMFFSRRVTGVLWPLILVANFTIAGYVLITRYIGTGPSKSETKDVPTGSTPPFTEPIQRVPIPEDQQRQLFKWLLEEKRKVKPKDAEEKRRIDEEKSILKQFIRAKAIPVL